MLVTGEKCLLFIIIFLCGISSIVLASSNEQAGSVYPVFMDYKPLAGEQLTKARAARDAADRMLQECMDKYPDRPMIKFNVNPPQMKIAPRTQEEIDAFLKVAAAFQEVIDNYKGTEIAAYCSKRIDMPYRLIGRYEDAINILENAAKEYAGTLLEYELYINIAHIYEGNLKDIKTAIQWFEKIPKPNNVGPDGKVSTEYYTHGDMYYIRSQTTIAKIEIENNQMFQGVERYNALIERYPYRAYELDKEMETSIVLHTSDPTSNPYEYLRERKSRFTEESDEMIPLDMNRDKTLPPEGIETWYYYGDSKELFKDFSEEEKAKYEENLSFLKQRWNIVADNEKQADESIRNLASIGDKVIDPIMYDFNSPDQSFSFRHHVVEVFEQLKSDKARGALLTIALGKTVEKLPSMKQWASRQFISSLEDKSQARMLLASDDSGVLNNTILALVGEPIDQDFLIRLAEILDTKINDVGELVLYWNAASIFAEDPSPTFASQKASLIINAIKDVPKIPIAEEFYSHSYMNYGETTYSRYINALSKIKGADKYLDDTTPQLTGKTRYCVLIARANRGDVSVKKEITDILADKEAGLFKAWAAGCFRYIGTHEDIPLLEILANSDTMERDPRVSMPSGPVFPVRTAAQDAIRAIQEK